MQVHMNLGDLQVFLHCRHSITSLDLYLLPSMCCYIHVNKNKNIPKHMTRFKWKQKVLFHQIKGFGRRSVGGMLLKKKKWKDAPKNNNFSVLLTWFLSCVSYRVIATMDF